MRIDDRLRHLERQAHFAQDDENAAIQLDLLRMRMSLCPTFVAKCQSGCCNELVYLDDQGTGDRCESCGVFFCYDHGRVGGSAGEADWEGECAPCVKAFENEMYEETLRSELMWWEQEGRELQAAEEARYAEETYELRGH